MSDDDKKIWVPPTPLDDNVKRMAWLLFLEAWKAYLAKHESDTSVQWEPEQMYGVCLKNAKVVRLLELPRNQPPLQQDIK